MLSEGFCAGLSWLDIQNVRTLPCARMSLMIVTALYDRGGISRVRAFIIELIFHHRSRETNLVPFYLGFPVCLQICWMISSCSGRQLRCVRDENEMNMPGFLHGDIIGLAITAQFYVDIPLLSIGKDLVIFVCERQHQPNEVDIRRSRIFQSIVRALLEGFIRGHIV
jgi:hypothetical protein